MLYSVIFIFIAVIIIFFLVLTKVVIELEYRMDDFKDTLGITASFLWGIIRLRHNFTKKGDKKRTKTVDKLYNVKQLYMIIGKTRKYLAHKIVLKNLRITSILGAGDAAVSSVLYGAAWALVGALLTMVSNYFKTESVEAKIDPDFSNAVFKVDIDCIFSVKFVYIIVVGFKILIFRISHRD